MMGESAALRVWFRGFRAWSAPGAPRMRPQSRLLLGHGGSGFPYAAGCWFDLLEMYRYRARLQYRFVSYGGHSHVPVLGALTAG